jgi:hypothetical protein
MCSYDNIAGNLGDAITEKEYWGLSGLVAGERKLRTPGATSTDAKGIAEGQVPTARLATREGGDGGNCAIALLASKDDFRCCSHQLNPDKCTQQQWNHCAVAHDEMSFFTNALL